jgi:hypothetical protein
MLARSPRPYMITVLDTHDGICIPDVEGVLPDEKIKVLIDNINAHSVGAIYQLTNTFYNALMQNNDAYIGARAIQFFIPGIPQVYYVGLFAGCNDQELMEQTGELRDINRHYYSLEEVAQDIQKPVAKRLLILMKFRNQYPTFDGHFELSYSNDSRVAMAWRSAEYYCHLFVNLNFNTAKIEYHNVTTGESDSFTC